MGEMPTFGSADIDVIVSLSISGAFMADELKQIAALRDKLQALIDYYNADYEDDYEAEYEGDEDDVDDWDDDE